MDLSLGNILDTFTLNARLQAAESEGMINVLSAPKIATLNNNSASIQSGVQLPIQTVANNTVTVQFKRDVMQQLWHDAGFNQARQNFYGESLITEHTATYLIDRIVAGHEMYRTKRNQG